MNLSVVRVSDCVSAEVLCSPCIQLTYPLSLATYVTHPHIHNPVPHCILLLFITHGKYSHRSVRLAPVLGGAAASGR